MFTPPPSPAQLSTHDYLEFSPPPALQKDTFVHLDEPPPPPSAPSPSEAKKRTGRRIRLSVVVVPLVLILIGLSTRCITHPILLDLLAAHPPSLNRSYQTDKTASIWKFHKRHPSPASQVAPAVASSSALPQSGTSFPSPTVAPLTGSNSPSELPSPVIPTIPASPPVLPTPFPQPFDSSLQANFTNAGCYNFFLNMTSTQPFRSCRPFSLLLQSSSQFINQSQSNLNVANAVQWGTCNTSIDQDQCLKNMDWFTINLQTACSVDLSQRNTLAVDALQGLQAYGLMREAGCLPDPSTNTFCFIEAISKSNPSDLYYYLLPLGIAVPTKSTPSCSACSKSLLALYGAVLSNKTQANLVGDGLRKTYTPTEVSANAQCGSGFAPVVKSSVGWRGYSLDVRGLISVIVATTVSLGFFS